MLVRLRVQSKTGLPRNRAGFTFDKFPRVIEVDDNDVYPIDSNECRQAGDWPTPLRSDGTREPATNRLKLILDDTDQQSPDQPGVMKRVGGLFVTELDDSDDAIDSSELERAHRDLMADHADARDALERERADHQATLDQVAALRRQLAQQPTAPTMVENQAARAPGELPQPEAATNPADPKAKPIDAPKGGKGK